MVVVASCADLIALELTRIAVAIPLLVMVQHRREDDRKLLDIGEDFVA